MTDLVFISKRPNGKDIPIKFRDVKRVRLPIKYGDVEYSNVAIFYGEKHKAEYLRKKSEEIEEFILQKDAVVTALGFQAYLDEDFQNSIFSLIKGKRIIFDRSKKHFFYIRRYESPESIVEYGHGELAFKAILSGYTRIMIYFVLPFGPNMEFASGSDNDFFRDLASIDEEIIAYVPSVTEEDLSGIREFGEKGKRGRPKKKIDLPPPPPNNELVKPIQNKAVIDIPSIPQDVLKEQIILTINIQGGVKVAEAKFRDKKGLPQDFYVMSRGLDEDGKMRFPSIYSGIGKPSDYVEVISLKEKGRIEVLDKFVSYFNLSKKVIFKDVNVEGNMSYVMKPFMTEIKNELDEIAGKEGIQETVFFEDEKTMYVIVMYNEFMRAEVVQPPSITPSNFKISGEEIIRIEVTDPIKDGIVKFMTEEGNRKFMKVDAFKKIYASIEVLNNAIEFEKSKHPKYTDDQIEKTVVKNLSKDMDFYLNLKEESPPNNEEKKKKPKVEVEEKIEKKKKVDEKKTEPKKLEPKKEVIEAYNIKKLMKDLSKIETISELDDYVYAMDTERFKMMNVEDKKAFRTEEKILRRVLD